MAGETKLPPWVLAVCVLIPMIGFTVSVFAVPMRRGNMLDHMGAEYDSIARAMVAGRGFSDPFEIQTGPTAWMPPVLPTLLAAGYWVADGNRNVVMTMFVALQGLAIGTMSFLVLSESVRIGRSVWGCVILTIGILANFETLFLVTHDHALLLLVVSAVCWALVQSKDSGGARVAFWQGLFGGFVALCSPVIAAVWAGGLVISWRRTKRWIVISAIVSIATIAPWMFRNRLVMGRWVPIKSAGKFELWQSMCPDNNGLMNVLDMVRHPWNEENEARQHYAKVGEIAFIDSYGPKIAAKLRADPVDVVDRTINRFLAATLIWSRVAVVPPAISVRIIRSLVFACPFLGLFVILSQHRISATHQEWVAIWIYVGVLLPYVMISYYERYAAPLIGIKMLMVLYAIDLLSPRRITVQTEPSKHVSPQLCVREKTYLSG